MSNSLAIYKQTASQYPARPAIVPSPPFNRLPIPVVFPPYSPSEGGRRDRIVMTDNTETYGPDARFVTPESKGMVVDIYA